ncbi:putative heme iron utilization protein [Prochlorococcus sp. SS52]|nr:putative heme iron utilization protein [Prochlorococcus marinus str. LG]KGG19158.1 putative heme iron utilization protein [Prochlorococcus marinus str. SS2]KGG23301.1 putative heme iron utilization protein [Prochlorococcus marinus str. SS35]KGG35652.1 putative heme iron utilization protein [Prochlorococcus sp. SS52]
MNSDHKDTLAKYAIHYGGINSVSTVEMLEITSLWMKLKVDGNDLQIPFDHTLIDSSDAHKTLVSMSKSIPE